MTDKEFLRQRREREFQQSVLKALEKPKQSRILKVINSPFFLWLLSALLLTLGGAYFAEYQQCNRDSAQIIDLFYRLTTELELRQKSIADAFAASNNFEELRTALKTHDYIYSDLRERTARDLVRQKRQLSRRISFDRAHSAAINIINSRFSVSPREITQFGGAIYGEIPSDVQASDFAAVKSYASRILKLENLRSSTDSVTRLSENCTPRTVVSLIFWPTAPIVAGSTWAGLAERINQGLDPRTGDRPGLEE
jgi:hypothetical protein